LYLLCAFVILPVIKIIIYLHTYLHKRSFIVRSLFNFTRLMCVFVFYMQFFNYVLCCMCCVRLSYRIKITYLLQCCQYDLDDLVPMLIRDKRQTLLSTDSRRLNYH